MTYSNEFTLFARKLFLVAFTVLGMCLLYRVRDIAMLVIISVGVAILMSPLIRFMEKRWKLPRVLAAAVVAIGVLAFLFLLFFVLYSVLADQFSNFIDQAPQLYQSLLTRVTGWFGRYPGLVARIKQTQTDGWMGVVAGKTLSGVVQGVTLTGAFLLVIAVSFFSVLHEERYLKGILTIFPKSKRKAWEQTFRESAAILRSWFLGQLIALSILGVIVAIGYLIIGVPYWGMFGLLTGVFDFIPIVGPTVAGALACLVCLGEHPDKVIWIVGFMLVVQQIEGNLLIPWVMRARVQLPEVHVILFMLVLGSLFGVLGVLIAPPVLAILRSIYLREYVSRMEQL